MRFKLKMLSIILGIITLTSCTLLDFFKPSGSDPLLSVDTEVTAGDKNQTAEVAANKIENTAETISNVTTNVNKTDWVAFGIFSAIGWIVGWITKTPWGMWSLIKRAFKKGGSDA